MYELVYSRLGELPPWLRIKNRGVLVVSVHGDGKKEVTVEDVVRYYAYEASNLLSGVRCLGSICGDWRQIDYLADLCLQVFKVLAINKLRKLSREYGLEPKF